MAFHYRESNKTRKFMGMLILVILVFNVVYNV